MSIDPPLIRVRDLHKDHWLVKAGKSMVLAHSKHETLLPALEEITEQYPQLSSDMGIAMWIGINSKDRENQYVG